MGGGAPAARGDAVVTLEGGRERELRRVAQRAGDGGQAGAAGAQLLAGQRHPPVRHVRQRGEPEQPGERRAKVARDSDASAARPAIV
jgi:hypothetical protein